MLFLLLTLNIFACISNLFLGLIVARHKKSLINIAFATLAIITSLWNLSNLVFLVKPSLLTMRLTYAFGTLVVGFNLSWVLVFARARLRIVVADINLSWVLLFARDRLKIAILSCFLAFTGAALSLTPLVITRFIRFDIAGTNIAYGPLFYSISLWSIITVFGSMIVLWRAKNRESGRRKNQIKMVFLGVLFFGLTAMLVTFILPSLGVDKFTNLNSPSSLFFIGFSTYAIIRHRLMDIRLLVIKSVTYSLTLAFVLASYIILAIFVFQKLELYLHPILLNALALFALVFTFHPVRLLLEKGTNRLFFKERYVFNELLAKVNNINKKNSRSINTLTNEIMKVLVEQMRVSKAAFILASDGSFSKVRARGFDNINKLLLQEPLALVLKVDKTLVRDDLEDGTKEKDILKASEVEVLIPIRTEERCEAILALGEKKSGDMYSSLDLNLLELTAPQIALTLENARLYEQAITDGLTGLYHHRYFHLRLKEEIDRAKRYKYPLTLIMLDLDFFKNINDKYGHQLGDEVLMESTFLIKQNVRSHDIIGRYGGDEFVILLPVIEKEQIKDHVQIVKLIAKRIKKVIQSHSFTKRGLNIKASLGIAVFNGKTAINSSKLLEEADKLLYKAKNKGRNTICIEVLKSKQVVYKTQRHSDQVLVEGDMEGDSLSQYRRDTH